MFIKSKQPFEPPLDERWTSTTLPSYNPYPTTMDIGVGANSNQDEFSLATPLSNFTSRTSMFSRDYDDDASIIHSNSNGANNLSPQRSIHNDVSPMFGFDIPKKELPGYQRSSINSQGSNGSVNNFEGGIPQYRLSNSGTHISSSNNVNIEKSSTPNDGNILYEGMNTYHQGNDSPWKSDDGNNIPYEDLHTHYQSNNHSWNSDGGTCVSNSTIPPSSEEILEHRQSNNGPQTSNVSIDIPHEVLPLYHQSEINHPNDNLRKYNVSPSSNFGVSNVDTIISKELPVDCLSVTCISSVSGLNPNNDIDIITTQITTNHPSTSSPRIANDDINIQEENMRRYHQFFDSDQIPIEHLASQNSTSRTTSQNNYDNGVNGVSIGITPSFNTFQTSKGKKYFISNAPPDGTISKVSGILPAILLEVPNFHNKDLTSNATSVDTSNKMSGISQVVPLEVSSVENAKLPLLMLHAQQMDQQVPCSDTTCLTHQCCVKVMCICDTRNSQSMVVESSNPIEQSSSSQRFSMQPLNSTQTNHWNHRRSSDPFPVRSNEPFPTRLNRTSFARSSDLGSTSSNKDRQKLRPITREQVSFSYKFFYSLLCQLENDMAL